MEYFKIATIWNYIENYFTALNLRSHYLISSIVWKDKKKSSGANIAHL
jgi:hypothetical protein